MLQLDPCVTVADFILALEEEEVKQLSNIDDPCSTDIDATKIQQALDRALCQINGSFVISGNCGKALIKLNCKNLQIDIARHLLDTVKARPHIQTNFEKACEQLEKFAKWDQENECPLTPADMEEILGEMPPTVDKGFRFNSDSRKWNRCNLRKRGRRLFDRRSVDSFQTRTGCCAKCGQKSCCCNQVID